MASSRLLALAGMGTMTLAGIDSETPEIPAVRHILAQSGQEHPEIALCLMTLGRRQWVCLHRTVVTPSSAPCAAGRWFLTVCPTLTLDRVSLLASDLCLWLASSHRLCRGPCSLRAFCRLLLRALHLLLLLNLRCMFALRLG